MKNLIILFCAAFFLSGWASAQDIGSPDMKNIKGLYPGKTYSPYAKRNFPNNVYWGETHLHTGVSLDAGLFGNVLGHEDAYRLCKGEEITSSTGLSVKLGRPLDWVVITDHSDLMGLAVGIQEGAPNVVAEPLGKKWHEAFERGGADAGEAAFELIQNFAQGTLPKAMLNDYSPGSKVYTSLWEDIIRTADKYNEPGKFTALIGYEWTSVPKGFNLHRNVILRDDKTRAGQVVPMVTLPPLGSQDPLDLYEWLEMYEEKTGGQALALSHNGNLSNGWMFPVDKTYAGGVVDKNYVEQRAKWEPLYEVTQIKGDGETHPFLSPDDEFADYETWDVGNLDISELKKTEMLAGEYAREALKNGLMLESKFGTNPYKFGMVGATDSHTSLSTAEEDNFFGKSVSVEPSKHRVEHPFIKSELGEISGDMIVASGYQGVWATENTREAIFDAMERKETYATTGPRIPVRFFGGWDFVDDDLRSRSPAFVGYDKGVPMGGDLRKSKGSEAPNFMVYALRDPVGANLDRIQIIKGWEDANGKLHERVYDVAVSDGRKINKEGRCKKAVGNTVDLESASWTNTIGASELMAVWRDPDFNPNEKAFYYARVIEIPTPRWLVYDKVRMGAHIPEGAELIGQERAYTSPIWYNPSE
ncbi:DUF3604 domain-containing protein [Carboxylicivirga marina]|uniref:DUF3604 domain-containing protein n=1 Tax=Carboxylicivirga marina TaxID=2800988 RepID=A0ABS1HJS7_9BACT|nr:DUF3604 domain-containing protein [Carboxylicivirga marina]MBK3517807.1 DUF3604 domain-containing protein [Carboxylicivirga marina]